MKFLSRGQFPILLYSIDSLKTILVNYRNQINEYRSKNEQKEAYETILKFATTKDTLQQLEQTQEFNRIDEKLNLKKQKAIEKIKQEENQKIELANQKRVKGLKYTMIIIVIALFFILIILFATKSTGKMIIPKRFLDGALFVSFLLLFEFIIVLSDPFIEQYTGGAPIWKLGFNMLMAFCIFPVHHYIEEKMRGRLFSAKRGMVEKRGSDGNR